MKKNISKILFLITAYLLLFLFIGCEIKIQEKPSSAPKKQPTWTIQHPVYTPSTKIDESTVSKYMTMPESDLRALITIYGGKGTNKTMKQIAYDMACLYQKTKDDAYADKAVILLERFAEVVPQWPLLKRDGVTPVPLIKVNWKDLNNSGLWGKWYHEDLEACVEIPKAYDLIANSGALERRNTKSGQNVRQFIENNLLRYLVELNLKFENGVFLYSNMGGNRINGIIPFGLALDPRYIHMVVNWIRLYPSIGYFRDGVWHESTPAYHDQITGRIARDLPKELKGYSDPSGYIDPVDGTRFDNLDIEKGMESQFDRIRQAIDHLALPNDYFLAVHDSNSDKRAWYVKRNYSEPYCYFGMRHAVLGRFSGKDQVQAHLHFSGTDGHEHEDCLNIVLWALGEELFSEGEYRDNYGSPRDWNSSTAGHNTVVVDEENQRGQYGSSFQPTKDDMVTGITYDPSSGRYSRNFGNLRLWDATHPNLQIVEAEGENAYDKSKVPLYRRTIVMVEIEGNAFYLIDIFRVKGGNIHDWILHGCLNEDYQFWKDLNMQDTSGLRYKYLNLQQHSITNSNWSSEFIMKNGNRIRTTMLGYPNTEISIGTAPAMRRKGNATFLDVRRVGGDSLFVCVHEPYNGAPKIQSVTPLLYTGKADSAVAIKITLNGGRTDYFASTLDNPPYPEHSIEGTDIKFSGRFMHIAEQNGSFSWMYLLEGNSISKNKISLSAKNGDLSYRGKIIDVKRVEKGDSWNGFVTTTDLPMDGSIDNKTLLLTLGDGRTEGYTISHITKQEGKTQINVKEEPGLELRENGSLTKLVYYPWHGIRGGIDFLISGSIYRNDKGEVETTVPISIHN